MIVLIPAEDVPLDSDGKPILGGIFCVPHKPGADRLINDRRPPNLHEGSLHWESLPHGSQLCLMILHPEEILRGSGDDLSNYFYLLSHSEPWLPRNAFGRRLRGEHYAAFGGKPGAWYYPAFRVVCMGDKNAVSIAQATHLALLEAHGCMRPEEVLAYRRPPPPAVRCGKAYTSTTTL